jgi:hypothetical protein
MHIMCSYMCRLEFQIDPPFNCADKVLGDVAFV